MYCPDCNVKMVYQRQDALYICPVCGGEGNEATVGDDDEDYSYWRGYEDTEIIQR